MASKRKIGRPQNGKWLKCKNCQEPFYVRPSELRKAKARGHKRVFCGIACQHDFYRGEGNPNWRGGKCYTASGYIYAYAPDHPFCTQDGYVMEHRLVIEKKLGRFLTLKEQVHHKNHKRDDNRLRNLKLMASSAEHRREHGEYIEEKCGWCDNTVMRSKGHRRKFNHGFCSRRCSALYGSWKAAQR